MDEKKTALIPKISAEIGAIGKDSKNPGLGYNYRGIEAMLDRIGPILSKHGVHIVPFVEEIIREQKETKNSVLIYTLLKVKYTFYGPDFSFLATVVGEGMDTGDKSANKAMTSAFKNVLNQVFNIPFSMVDSETDHHEVVKKKEEPKNGCINTAQLKLLKTIITKRALDPATVKAKIKEKFNYTQEEFSSKDILAKDFDAVKEWVEKWNPITDMADNF